MKPHFASLLTCAGCHGPLTLDATEIETVARPLPAQLPPCGLVCAHPSPGAPCGDCLQLEIVRGRLTCARCPRSYDIDRGVPWTAPSREIADNEQRRTASSFGHLWQQSIPRASDAPRDYHFEKMARALGVSAPAGLVLDAGCGDGIDLEQRAHQRDTEIVGAEISVGGCLTTARRIRGLPNAHVVQADLARLPFRDRAFDFAYSYGVLHHMPRPDDGLKDLRRVLRGGAAIALYLYEDFSDRSFLWRGLLALANAPRVLTTRLPHRVLYALCQIGSPMVFVTLTVPHRLLRRVPSLRSFADTLPFRHGTGPFSMTGDLYDRFSAPIEFRYSRQGTESFVSRAGLVVRAIAKERGWMALAVRPE